MFWTPPPRPHLLDFFSQQSCQRLDKKEFFIKFEENRKKFVTSRLGLHIYDIYKPTYMFFKDIKFIYMRYKCLGVKEKLKLWYN